MSQPSSEANTLGLTIIALVAFAANSVLCRLALDGGHIDPGSFTFLRLFSGAITLTLLVIVLAAPQPSVKKREGSWLGGFYLFGYAVCFSYAYVSLPAGTGALILFGSVQVSMLVFSWFKGERFSRYQWFGIAIAFSGLVFLMLPGAESPSLMGFVLMALSGLAWGGYTILGKKAGSPLLATTQNFQYASLLSLPLLVILYWGFNVSAQGVFLAIASGAIASGFGYAIWYKVLPRLHAATAAVSQLSVPIIATLGGVILIAEPLTLRLSIASLLVLGGIFVVIKTKPKSAS